MLLSIIRTIGKLLPALVLAASPGCQQNPETVDPARVANLQLRTVSAVGRIEPGEGIIFISGPMGERIDRVLVKPGQKVRGGEQLVELVAEKVLAAQVDLARAKFEQAQKLLAAEKEHADALIAEAEQALQRATELPDIQIAAADAEIKIYEVQLQQAERDYERLAQVTPIVDLDRHKQPVDRLREQLRAARAKLRLLEKERDFAVAEAKKKLASLRAGVEKAAAAIDVGAARRNVALAEAELARVSVFAPVQATVLQVFAQPGETISQQPLLSLGTTDAMYVTAEVHEADVARVKVGQQAKINSVALEQELTGTVDRIGQVVQKNQVFGLDPTAKTDARVIEVRIRLDNPEPAAERIGLQVDVTIDTQPKESASDAPAPTEP